MSNISMALNIICFTKLKDKLRPRDKKRKTKDNGHLK